MTEVVSIRFKSRGKVYYFDPAGVQAETGQPVIVETSKGLELGECAMGNHYVPDERILPPLRPVVRVATPEDLRVAEVNKAREKEAFQICQRKIADHGLDMKLVDVECNFEGNKILFFFTSDGRVDFRELVKDLASVFRTRIELRQIGVRDEAKMLGGLGLCGRPFCCSQFLDDFQPVSTKMAKIQSMSLNPAKISGICGRLMCCLRYEQVAYEDLVKKVPKNGTYVETPAGYGSIAQVNLLRQKVKVKLDGEGEQVIKQYDADEIAVVPGGRPKNGETPPSVLKPRIRKPEPVEEPEDKWEMPELIFNSELEQHGELPDGESPQAPPKKRSSRRRGGRKKPSGAAQGETPKREEKPAEAGKPPRNKAKPAPQQAKTEGAAAAPAGEKSGERRSRGGRRRYGRSRSKQGGENGSPKPGGENGSPKQGGPKPGGPKPGGPKAE